MEKEYVISKEKQSDFGDNRTRYYSLTDSAYFDRGKSPLKEAKLYAKLKGYETLKVIGRYFREKDKIYVL
jgi:hypothetical protein